MAEIEYLCRRCEHGKAAHQEIDAGNLGIVFECALCRCHMWDPEDNLEYLLRVDKRKKMAMAKLEKLGTWVPRLVCFCHHGKEWHEKGKCWYLDCLC
jgi:hypothetical protein